MKGKNMKNITFKILSLVLICVLSSFVFVACSNGTEDKEENSKTKYTLTILVNENDYGSVSGYGVFDEGEIRTIIALPKDGYSFLEWSDGDTSSVKTILMNSNKTFTANFIKGEFIRVKGHIVSVENGSVTLDESNDVVLVPKNATQFGCWELNGELYKANYKVILNSNQINADMSFVAIDSFGGLAFATQYDPDYTRNLKGIHTFSDFRTTTLTDWKWERDNVSPQPILYTGTKESNGMIEKCYTITLSYKKNVNSILYTGKLFTYNDTLYIYFGNSYLNLEYMNNIQIDTLQGFIFQFNLQGVN